MRKDLTPTEPRNILIQKKRPWSGVVILPIRKDWNSFLMAQMEKFKIPTVMVLIHVRLRTPGTNSISLYSEQV